MKEAKYYSVKDSTLNCELCPHNCIIKENGFGICGVRKNKSKKLYSLVYGKPCSIQIDPIEKKPLYHFLPESKTLSLGTVGCNLKCLHCQNWDISTSNAKNLDNTKDLISPEKIVRLAKEKNCASIAFTYNEPTIFFEYMIDICKIAKKEKIKTLIVSNGYINPAPLKELLKYIDAANIDLKGFDNIFYKNICKADLTPVLESLIKINKSRVHLEITNLIIPTLNDKIHKIKEMINWIIINLGKDVPLHFSAFFPYHKLNDLHSTDPKIIEKFRKIGLELGLNYVYSGNIVSKTGGNTYCPSCSQIIIKRTRYLTNNLLKKGKCNCGKIICGVF